ncbi:hypothetical protein ACFRAA_23780, partial [[Kitasatospora] papulosa]
TRRGRPSSFLSEPRSRNHPPFVGTEHSLDQALRPALEDSPKMPSSSPAQLRADNAALVRTLASAQAKIRYLKAALALMIGLVAGLVAYLVVGSLDASPLTALGSSATSFVVATGFVFTLQEKMGRA